MPQVEVTIGGRNFEVACQAGEEPFLRSAAAMLDTEAQALSTQIGRMPESRMLLMAGLLLADKTAALEDRLREAEKMNDELSHAVARLEARSAAEAEPEVVEVPILPQDLADLLTGIAEQTEALAERLEAAD